jgi:hypothetical protein
MKSMRRRTRQFEAWGFEHPFGFAIVLFTFFALLTAFFAWQFPPRLHETKSHNLRELVTLPILLYVTQILAFILRRESWKPADKRRELKLPRLRRHRQPTRTDS